MTPRKLVGEPFCISKKIWYSKIWCIGGSITVFPKKFCLTALKNFIRDASLFQKLSGTEIKLWMAEKKQRHHDFVDFFLLHSAEKIRKRTLLCFEKRTWYQKLSCRGGGHHGSVKNFCLRGLKKFVWEPFDFSKESLHPKFSHRGGVITVFSKCFVSQYQNNQNNSRGDIQCITHFGVPKIFMHKWAVTRFSVKKLLSHSAVKNQKGAVFWFKKIQLSKIFMHSMAAAGRVIKLLSTFLTHSTDKHPSGSFLYFKTFPV